MFLKISAAHNLTCLAFFNCIFHVIIIRNMTISTEMHFSFFFLRRRFGFRMISQEGRNGFEIVVIRPSLLRNDLGRHPTHYFL